MDTPDQDLLQRPIVVVGSPRSGTALISRILSKHSELYYAEEPRLTWRFGNAEKSDLLRPEDARSEVVQHIRGAFAQRVRQAGRSRLLEKTPSNALRVPFVDRVFPDAVFIHILRNGYDSALSIRDLTKRGATGLPRHRVAARLKEFQLRDAPRYSRELVRRLMPWLPGVGKPVWGPRLPGIDGMARDLEPLELAALQWKQCVELACYHGRRLPADRYLELRLESLSVPVVERVLDFVGLTPEPEVLKEIAENFRSEITSRRRGKASERELSLLAPWVEPTLAWLELGDRSSAVSIDSPQPPGASR